LHRTGRGIEEISLGVAPGEVLGVLGPAGSGKSTLLLLLATCLEPSSGEFELFGATSARGRRDARPRIGYMPQADSHFDSLSGFHNLYFFGSLYGRRREKLLPRVDGLFDELELRALRDQPVGRYDADARRRLSLAQALAHEPDLVLLDEPTHHMHYGSISCLRHAVARAAGRSAAVVIASSRVPGVEGLCSRLAILSRGRIVEQGAADALLGRLAQGDAFGRARLCLEPGTREVTELGGAGAP
jgi:ABC-2 type transport system ATP-binding protein